MNETQTLEFVVSYETPEEYTETSDWLVDLGSALDLYQRSGWNFVAVLAKGIDDLSRRKEKTALYADAHAQYPKLSIKRMKNLVSLSHKPYCKLAKDLELEIAHVEAVLGLSDDEAEAILLEAAENGLSANAIGATLRKKRQANVAYPDSPDNGNQRSINDDVLADNDVPFDTSKPNVLYENADDYSDEADAYAGDPANYEYIDESDSYTYTGEEFAQRMIDGANRLRRLAELQDGWQRQRTQREWIMKIDELIY